VLIQPEVTEEIAVDATTPSCLTCRSGDGEHDAKAWKVEALCVDECHLSVAQVRCPVCGCRALSIWTELIDWDDGDDSQASIIVPVPADVPLDSASPLEEAQVSDLLKRIGPCTFLVRSSPRGSRGRADWHRRFALPFLLPHD